METAWFLVKIWLTLGALAASVRGLWRLGYFWNNRERGGLSIRRMWLLALATLAFVGGIGYSTIGVCGAARSAPARATQDRRNRLMSKIADALNLPRKGQCWCGCGQPTSAWFAVGHDCRFISKVLDRLDLYDHGDEA